MKQFELSNKQNKDGMRDIRIVLHEIYPESTFAPDGTGSQTNLNGLAWREKWTKANKDTIRDKSIRVEFLNSERTEIWGHGSTDLGADNIPHFEDATVIGHFKKAEIEQVTLADGKDHLCLVGYGVLDAMCYPAFVEQLESEWANGETIHGSVEILKDADHDEIVYENGYHKDSRTPQFYTYSGYAILSIKEADPAAVLLEINENKEESPMTAEEMKALAEQIVSEMNNADATIEQIRTECDQRIAEANEARDAAINEKNELVASSEQIQAALDGIKAEYQELNEKYDTLWQERCVLEQALAEAKARERIGEMNQALARFTDEQKAYASEEMEKFNEDPMSVEINSVVEKILAKIGENALQSAETEKHAAEQNAAQNPEVVDIFGVVEDPKNPEDTNIF